MGGVRKGRGKRQSGERDTLILLWHDRLHHAQSDGLSCLRLATQKQAVCAQIFTGLLAAAPLVTLGAAKMLQAACKRCSVTSHQSILSLIVYPYNHYSTPHSEATTSRQNREAQRGGSIDIKGEVSLPKRASPQEDNSCSPESVSIGLSRSLFKSDKALYFLSMIHDFST